MKTTIEAALGLVAVTLIFVAGIEPPTFSLSTQAFNVPQAEAAPAPSSPEGQRCFEQALSQSEIAGNYAP